MPVSWTEVRSNFKSPLRVVSWCLWRSREANAQQCRRLKQQLGEAQALLAQQGARLQRQAEEIDELKQQVRRLENALRRPTPAPTVLPDDPPLKGHHYGRRLIALAINLVRAVGLRATPRVLKTVWKWLGINAKVPHWTTIRRWLLRVGVAALKEPVERADDWVWLVDHSNQMGVEKALAVLGVRASQLPPLGQALRHEDVHLLTVQPGAAWKRENMAAAYRELAERCGTPRAVLCDGAVELRDGAAGLKNAEQNTLVLLDFKHKAATFLQAAVGKHPRFAAFYTEMSKTRAAIQQTELAPLTPPGKKPKARFMNLSATLDWAAVILWLLDHSDATARTWFTAARLEEKLGWLRSFAADVAVWRECQQVVDAGVKFINQQGLFRGAGAQLRAAMGANWTHAASRQLAERLVAFVTAAEDQLKEGERLPMSTEILESTFALYKQLERQHSKGGFTSLLAGFGALLKEATPDTITRALTTTSNQDVREWVRDNLGDTLTSKRLATYREFRSATELATTT